MAVRFSWPADAAYERFVAEHAPGLRRLAVLLTGNRHDADDVFQDAVIAVAAKWASIRNPDAALAYLRRALSRKAIDLKRRPVEADLAAVPERALAEVGFLRLEEDAEFVRMLQTIPGKQRAVLVLRYYADFDDKTIAQLLGCTVQTVRSQASRALAKLREDLSPALSPIGGELDGSH